VYDEGFSPLSPLSWAVTQSELVRSNPRVMKAGEHREDKEGECFVRFGHGGGLTPSNITIKVRTCGERKRSDSSLTSYGIAEPD
jgi:hypothetical protein